MGKMKDLVTNAEEMVLKDHKCLPCIVHGVEGLTKEELIWCIEGIDTEIECANSQVKQMDDGGIKDQAELHIKELDVLFDKLHRILATVK